MRKRLPPAVWIALLLVFLSSSSARAQSIENFRWLDLRQPSDVQTIVARALMNEPYTMLREIGYIGLPPKETRDTGQARQRSRDEQRRPQHAEAAGATRCPSAGHHGGAYESFRAAGR